MARKIDRYTAPPLFEEVSFPEGVYPLSQSAASKSSKELWLIRAPAHFDGSALNDVSLNLDGEVVEFSSAGKRLRKYEAVSIQALQENGMESPYLLLPSKDKEVLLPAPAFRGQVTIMETPTLPPSDGAPDIEASKAPEMPRGLRQRFRPFGWGEDICSKVLKQQFCVF
ncbi:DNA-directed RNA polymerase I subunit RPA34-like [Diadema antillarum]|uniref:DNA-directed RNA polymerase I subunit RPA34-like n=1 Tax=Diadema antillarum TaxID=105358 RepID=UPI003A841705